MSAAGSDSAAGLEQYRPFLRFLARIHLNPELRGKIETSDVVQEVLVKAVQSLAQFRGETEAEKRAWSRRILARHLMNVVRDMGRDMRDFHRERSLDVAIEHSSVRLEAWLATDQTSPSMKAEQNEQLARLLAAIDRLPEAQREAVNLHHLHGMQLTAIAEQMGRTLTAVAG